MIKIAISGNIASGKSEVENLLLAKGYKVLDSDKVCHNLISSDKTVIEAIVATFGNSIFDSKNQISRQKLGEIIFSDSSKKVQLENILHPKIKQQIQNFIIENKSQKFVFVSVPLLFEANMEKDFDKIIFVSALETIRLKRLMQRNNLNEEQAKLRIDAQQNEQDKIDKSDFVIHNNSSLKELELQLEKVLVALSAFNSLL